MLKFEGNCVVVLGQPLEVTHHAGNRWLSVRSICELFGLGLDGQRRKLLKHPVIATAMLPALTAGGTLRDQAHVEVGSLPFWLFQIEDKRLSPEVREKVVRFQCECADVIEGNAKLRKLAAGILGQEM
jgi:hypothetical protein